MAMVATVSAASESPVTAKDRYSSVAENPPTRPSAASTPRNDAAAHFTRGLASSAPSPSAATYPATMTEVATTSPRPSEADSASSASS